ncbi:hypothetical protein APSETT445_007232 [Aspergillus pseudonomiae]
MEAAGIEIDQHDNGQPYKPEDIVILSDGICSSACALFMELMHHEAGVRTVVIGGQPSYGPMQAPSGTRGAAVYKAENMHQDIDLARDIDNSMHVDLPNRAHAFFITTATVNLRDQEGAMQLFLSLLFLTPAAFAVNEPTRSPQITEEPKGGKENMTTVDYNQAA